MEVEGDCGLGGQEALERERVEYMFYKGKGK